MTTTAPRQSTLRATICPPWCDDHDGFKDGSSDWHKTKPVRVGHVELEVTCGTLSGEPEMFMATGLDLTVMSLDSARTVARAMLAMCDAVDGKRSVE